VNIRRRLTIEMFGSIYRVSDECLILMGEIHATCQTEFTCSERWYMYNTEILLEKQKI